MIASPSRLLLPLLASMLLLGVPEAVAQIGSAGAGGAAVYRYAEPGEPTIAVQVWGDVGRTGLFQIPRDTDLIKLLTLTGGPVVTGDRPRQRTKTDVSIVRQQDGARNEVFAATLDEISNGTIPLPGLQEGDIVKIEMSVREVFQWRDAISIISAAGTLTLLVFRITDRL